jgi:cellulose synthase/poly-beta-1,6-N-acetylglucosamine synthase-like glycosyltransferase
MPVLQVLGWLLLAVELYLAMFVAYLGMLCISAIIATKKRQTFIARLASTSPLFTTRFAILIPAHNEEKIIDNLLHSLSELVYPKELYSVHVVADNCTDRTAELVRATGWALVHERFNEQQRGKGYALNWLLRILEEQQLTYDAYVVIDADSIVESQFLNAMALELSQGERALQAYNTVLNASASPSAALRLLAMTLINHVRPLGRNGLGASSTLTGNGMCMSRELLQQHPWQAYGIAEDYQYYLTLVEDGERVRYVPEAVVRSQMPMTFAQMKTQDIRWESSDPEQTNRHAFRNLLRLGLQHRDTTRLEAAMEMLTPPLSLLMCGSIVVLLASLLLWTPILLVLSTVLVCGLLFYIGTALYLLRPSQAIYKALLYAPGFMIWKLWVYFVLSKSKEHTSDWVRTNRI